MAVHIIRIILVPKGKAVTYIWIFKRVAVKKGKCVIFWKGPCPLISRCVRRWESQRRCFIHVFFYTFAPQERERTWPFTMSLLLFLHVKWHFITSLARRFYTHNLASQAAQHLFWSISSYVYFFRRGGGCCIVWQIFWKCKWFWIS